MFQVPPRHGPNLTADDRFSQEGAVSTRKLFGARRAGVIAAEAAWAGDGSLELRGEGEGDPSVVRPWEEGDHNSLSHKRLKQKF